MSEIVYINGGEVYKSSDRAVLNERYTYDPNGDREFPFVKDNGKRYFVTQAFKDIASKGIGISLEWADLCPRVGLWLALGARFASERSDFDLFFAFESPQQMQTVADYYGLPLPVSHAFMADISANPDYYAQYMTTAGPIVTCAIQFSGGKPVLFKLYTFPREVGTWDVWMEGALVRDGGTLVEHGAVYQRQDAVVDALDGRPHDLFTKVVSIVSERDDGAMVYHYGGNDPLFQWYGVDALGRTRHYESSRALRRLVASLDTGPTLAEYDLCPSVPFWLGRAWTDGDLDVEVLFAVQDSQAVSRACEYYHLPVPYSAEQRRVLDTQPEYYRATSLDLFGRGPGNYAPIVVCGVTFTGGSATAVRMYLFTRPWERVLQ